MYIIIPARYNSSRFPGKPLALINGIPVIQHTWNNAIKITENVFIATDDLRIYDTARKFGAVPILTDHAENGTERCYEAAEMLGIPDNELVINLQCDEVHLSSKSIEFLAKNHFDPVSTLHYNSDERSDDPNDVKVIINKSCRAVFFTRNSISYNIHVGIYAFKMHVLRMYHTLGTSFMELEESLEQMRFIDNDIYIRSNLISFPGKSIDVPEDLPNGKNP